MWLWALFILIVLLVRLHMVLPGIYSSKPATSKRTGPIKTLIVLGSGGHTAEMFRLLRGFNTQQYSPRVYVVAETDKHSYYKLVEFEGENKDWKVEYIPRSREVGQSYFTSLFTTFNALLYSLILVFKIRPDLWEQIAKKYEKAEYIGLLSH